MNSLADPTITTLNKETVVSLAKTKDIRQLLKGYEIAWNT
jgi:hypothetical protein